MTVYPNAKINVGLAVTHRRPDGYHDLETVFIAVPGLHDVLEVEKADDLTFEQRGIEVDCPPEKNLILKAYNAVKETFPKKVENVHILFTKNIPFGAGLGGGSADAAFMVHTLNELFELGMTNEDMEKLVAPLGADCAFFIQNRPRFASGIGNVFAEPDSAILQYLEGKYIVLVKPDCAVSTAHAYRGIVPRDQQEEQYYQPWQNDFENTVFPLFPEIAAIKQQLIDLGASFASMSGSGATVFGIFDKEEQAKTAASSPLFKSYFVHLEQFNLL